MTEIAIITDSDSSIPMPLAEKYKIQQIPISIHFDDETFSAIGEINDLELFEIIDKKNKLPTTSAPPPSSFEQAFQNAFSSGAESIICITVSSKISATYNAALSAAESFPDRDITIIDSLTLCAGQGIMVLEAAKKARDGGNKEEILALIDSIRERLHVFAVLPTLKYLAMGGRVGKLAAGFADAFNVKPILTAKEGKLELLEKVRTQKKAEIRLLELMKEAIKDKKIEQIAMIHVNNLSGAEDLYAKMKSLFDCPEKVIYADFTPGLSVHAGSGVVGYFILTER
ncbi:MAG: DegV family protein [Anaerolineaceae bacterium]